MTLFVIPLKKPVSQNEYDREELSAIWDLSVSVPLFHSQYEWITPLSVILELDDI